jgi:Arc/MetJ family transcription regulator
MAFETIEIDEEACAVVMAQHGFNTRQQAINYALRKAVTDPMTIEEAKAMRGTGWDGDLDEMRHHEPCR